MQIQFFVTLKSPALATEISPSVSKSLYHVVWSLMYDLICVMHDSYQGWHISLCMPDDGVLLPAMLFFYDFWVNKADRISSEHGVRIPLKACRTSTRVYFMYFRFSIAFYLVSFQNQYLCNTYIILYCRPLHLFG